MKISIFLLNQFLQFLNKLCISTLCKTRSDTFYDFIRTKISLNTMYQYLSEREPWNDLCVLVLCERWRRRWCYCCAFHVAGQVQSLEIAAGKRSNKVNDFESVSKFNKRYDEQLFFQLYFISIAVSYKKKYKII